MQLRQSFFAAVILVVCVAACWADEAKTCSPTKAIPVILDTDIGDDIDDTWALLMLLKSPQFDVKLITTTYGNAEYRAKLIAKFLTIAKRTDIPVGLGAGKQGGIGKERAWVEGYKLSDYPGKIYQDGVAAVIDTIEKSPEPITVLAIGPLDTMAAVVAKRPDIVKKAKFVGMDGSIYKGYDGAAKPSPEYNIEVSILAAQKVFTAPWMEMVITPLDTCGLVRLSGERFESLKRSKDPAVQALLDCYRVWSGKAKVDELKVSSVLFDTVAIYLADPGPDSKSLVEMKTVPLVVTNNGFTRVDPKGQNVSAAIAWKNLDAYNDLLVKILLTP